MPQKVTLILLGILIAFGCSTEQKKKPLKLKSNEFYSQEMKEEQKAADLNVKSRIMTTYFYERDGKLNDRGYVVEEIYFDISGNKAVQIRYGAGELIDLQYEWHYDDEGNMRYSRSTDMYGKEMYYRESEYNSTGAEISREERDEKGYNEFITLYTYNDSGLVTEEAKRKKKGSLISRIVYSYNDSNIVQVENYDLNSRLQNKRVYTYDSLGFLDTETLIEGSSFSNKTDYKFDSAGNVLEIDEGYFKRTFEYNDNGDVIVEKAFNGDGGLQQVLIFEYNEKGLVKSRVKTDGEETPVIFTEYKYEFF